MKTSTIIAATLGLLCVGTNSFAQFGVGKSQDPSELLGKLMGSNSAFSGTAVFAIRDTKGKINMSTKSELAMLDGKMRSEFDMTDVRGGDIDPQMMQQLALFGMQKTITILRPDKKVTYLIYPAKNAYVEMPEQKPASGSSKSAEPKIEKTELGKETVDDHPCIKYKVVITDDKGQKIESLMWEATDLKNFPIKSEYSNKEGTVVATFKNLKLDKPAATLFEPPASAKKYDSVEKLMMESLGGAFGGK